MSRPRGRPPKSEDPATRDRLLEAATAECVDVGFDTVTLAAVAARAGVTPAAVYNHFADKEELLYTAGRVAIGRLAERFAPAVARGRGAHEVAAAFLDPSFGPSRRLILELHLAGTRHPQLAAHLADWHREFATPATADRPPAAEQLATIKALFLLLLGLCHLEDLAELAVPPESLAARVERLVDALFAN